MKPLTYLLIVDLACIASGTYLVATEHYGWAWIPFLLVATTTVRTPKPDQAAQK